MTATENEIFATLKCSILDENRPLLCSNLDPKLHYPYLRSKGVLSKHDEEEIESQTMTKLKVHKLIDILMQRCMGYDHLVTSIIQERTQIFLAKTLNKAFEEKKKRLNALIVSKSQEGTKPATSTLNGNTIQANSKLLPTVNKRDSFPRTNQKDSSYCAESTPSELESLPKPVMSKSSTLQEGYKSSRTECCENSFESDSGETSSIPNSLSTRNESKA